MVREVLTARVQESTLAVRAGEIESVRRADVTRTGLRLYDGAAIGVAGGLGDPDLGQLEARARDALAAGIAYGARPGRESTRREEIRADLEGVDALLAETEAVLAHARDAHPDLIFFNMVKAARHEVRLENDTGLDLAHVGHSFQVALLYKERGSHHILDGQVVTHGTRWDRDAYLAMLDATCEAFRTPAALPPGEVLPVVLPATSGLAKPLDWFARHLDGRAFASGASPLAELAGEAAFSPEFTLVQSRHPDDGAGAFFDAEGVWSPGDRVPLIDAGTLVGPFTDRRTAHAHDLPLTGAAAGPHDGVPQLAAPMLVARPGTRSVAEILDGHLAVYVAISSGGDTSATGDWAAPVQQAFLTDGTRLLGRLPELALRGNLFRMLGDDLLGVSADDFPAGTRERALVCRAGVEVIG